MAVWKLILMTLVTSSDGLMVVNTDDKCDQLRLPHGSILMTNMTSSDGLMVDNTDDNGDQFRWPHGS